jgi:hypothetical protein
VSSQHVEACRRLARRRSISRVRRPPRAPTITARVHHFRTSVHGCRDAVRDCDRCRAPLLLMPRVTYPDRVRHGDRGRARHSTPRASRSRCDALVIPYA